ncbi:tyrosine-type recombinase/integrase [Shewanella sp. 10N.286.51.B8]|uniref:tyrosine-type recombinase/integrase n=1 Tax=Shewanella sp. 10N.286.51.B8 TaxID=3229708 RepID=UPI00354E4079
MAGISFRTHNQAVSLKKTGKRYEAYRASSERGKGRLGVEVSATGTKRWFYRYFFEGKRQFIRLGLVTDDYIMTKAQGECEKFAELLSQGKDPKFIIQQELEAKEQAEKAEVMKGSIQQLFEAYTKQMKTDGKRTYKAVLKSLEKEVYPFLPPASKAKNIKPTDIVPILSAMIKRGAVTQSNRVRSYIVAAFNYGLKHDLNPAQEHTGVKFGLSINPAQLVPKQSHAEKVGENWLSLNEVHYLLSTIHTVPRVGFVTCTLLQLCFHTGGQRPYELVASKWESVNWVDKTLLITSNISKNKREHLIPLTESALSFLRQLEAISLGSPFIFPRNNDPQNHLRTDSFSKAIARYRAYYTDSKAFIGRDIRRTCKTLMGELGIAKDVRDRLQNHALNDVSSKHYDRYDYLPEKREALRKWESKLIGQESTVIKAKFR